MDELLGIIFAPIAAMFFFFLAAIFLPFVLLGQIVYELTRPSGQRHGLSWKRETVFQHFKESVWEGVVVYGIAVISFVAALAGLVVGVSLVAEQEPIVIEEPEDGLVKRVVTAGGKAALAEAEERGWLDRFRGDDEGAAEGPATVDAETDKEPPFWKFWE